jgi:hypothetical protein
MVVCALLRKSSRNWNPVPTFATFVGSAVSLLPGRNLTLAVNIRQTLAARILRGRGRRPPSQSTSLLASELASKLASKLGRSQCLPRAAARPASTRLQRICSGSLLHGCFTPASCVGREASVKQQPAPLWDACGMPVGRRLPPLDLGVCQLLIWASANLLIWASANLLIWASATS